MIRFTHPLVLISLAGLIFFFIFFPKKRKGIILRLLISVLILVALAGPQIGLNRNQQNVYLLIDSSPSITATTSEEEIRNQVGAILNANGDHRFGLISFAQRAVVTTPFSAKASTFDMETGLGESTDLNSGVKLALSALPKEGTNQILLLSDGNITDGLTEAISAAQKAQIPISTVPVGKKADKDALLTRLEIPGVIGVDQPFSVEVTVKSNQDGSGLLVFYLDGELRKTREVILKSGLNRFNFTDSLSSKGAHLYRAMIKRSDDPIPANDSLSSLIKVSDQPGLLVISAGKNPPITSLLQAAGRPYVLSQTLPSLEELSSYKVAILTGFPFKNLTPKSIEMLDSFVADLGGGLVVVEGEKELRGINKEKIEDLLPVSYTLPQRAREANLAVVYILDRSSSMRGHATGAAKIEILKETAAASINLLEPKDLVGIIAFDRNFEWLVPIQPVGDGVKIYNGLRKLEAGGGTDIYYPLMAGFDHLEDAEAKLKHILLLSDGKTINEYRDFPGLTDRLEEQDHISLSTIVIGPDPNLEFLRSLVQAGSGTLYRAYDFHDLPKISMQATQRLSRSRFITGWIEVTGKLKQDKLRGIPSVQGYTLTYPKPTAEVFLQAKGDPLLARWQYGLGKIAALNVDLAGRWSKEWLA